MNESKKHGCQRKPQTNTTKPQRTGENHHKPKAQRRHPYVGRANRPNAKKEEHTERERKTEDTLAPGGSGLGSREGLRLAEVFYSEGCAGGRRRWWQALPAAAVAAVNDGWAMLDHRFSRARSKEAREGRESLRRLLCNYWDLRETARSRHVYSTRSSSWAIGEMGEIGQNHPKLKDGRPKTSYYLTTRCMATCKSRSSCPLWRFFLFVANILNVVAHSKSYMH